MVWQEFLLGLVVEGAEYEMVEAAGCQQVCPCLHVAWSRLFAETHAWPEQSNTGELLGSVFVLCNRPAALSCHAKSSVTKWEACSVHGDGRFLDQAAYCLSIEASYSTNCYFRTNNTLICERQQ